MASPTVRSFSASSSGMSMLNSFSNSITSSTVSRLSAPRSSMKLASLVGFSRSTPSSLAMISLTFSSRSAMDVVLNWVWLRCNLRVAKRYGKLHDHAAVHHEDVPRDVRRVLRRKERDEPRDVGRCAESAEGNLCRQLGTCIGCERFRHVGVDEPRCDGVGEHVA